MVSISLISFARICAVLLVSVLALANDQLVLDSRPRPPVHTTGILRRFIANNEQEKDRILALAFESNADIWQVNNSHVDIYVPSYGEALSNELLYMPHTHSIIQEQPKYTSTDSSDGWGLDSFTNSTYHENYHPLYEIDEFMRELASLHPDLVTIHNLGHSAEGREMLAMTLSTPSSNSTLRRIPGVGKLGFVIVGAQHAREWVATATSLYIAHALVANSSEYRSLRHLLEDFDFHIVPAPNPDGYSYTWETDRYWYKNRQILGPHLQCVGVDMNRNWGYKWKPTVGDIPTVTRGKGKHHRLPADPCSHWYPGHRPFEAPEVNNIANFVITLPNLAGFLDLRSYGQMLSSPFSYTCKKLPKDAEDQIEAAMGATYALRLAHGTHFETGGLCYNLYPAPGNILDWMYKIVGIKFSYVAHLRDTGTYGFSLPESWIRPVGEETAKMVEYLSKFINTHTKRETTLLPFLFLLHSH
ncbi:Putative metallocarboxypeptidase ECM14 [Leucoagaricus sp. SymC.cos]|nr:Putative metallocarboxypeptidase ECM14 [Leucoagaricus sp. SymC.cos]